MSQAPSVLIVDDNEADIYLIRQQLVRSGRFGPIFSLPDGEDALELFLNPNFAKRQLPGGFPPDVILLDINMPRMDGFEFLEAFEEIRARDAIPSVVLMVTSSDLERDRIRASRFASVKRYLVKPPTAHEVIEIADSLAMNRWVLASAGELQGVKAKFPSSLKSHRSMNDPSREPKEQRRSTLHRSRAIGR